tara:strand:+ start:346 stop:690 length:345 start_codon:yes stop_codon:yes gene_type:complete
MADLKITGTVMKVKDTETFKGGFSKRAVIVHDKNKKYNSDYEVYFTKDDCVKADDLKINSTYEFFVWVDSRGWQKDPQSDIKYFVSLNVDTFNQIGEAPPQAQTVTYNNAEVPF